MSNPVLETLKLPVKENGVIVPTVFDIPQGTVTEADLEEAEGTKADAIVRSASGDIASYDDGGDLPMKSLKVNIVPKQSGTGDPSPSNVRPISGTDEVVVGRSGKNLSSVATASYSSQGVVASVLVGKKGKYTLSAICSNNGTGIGRISFLQYKNGVAVDKTHFTQIPVGTNNQKLFVTADLSEIDFDEIRILAQGQTVGYNVTLKDIQFEFGDTATDYVPYEADSIETITKTLPQTVYGGTLDVVSGKLVIEKYSYSFNGGESITSTVYKNHQRFDFANVLPDGKNAKFSLSPDGTCSVYNYNNNPVGENQTDKSLGIYLRGIYVRDDSIADSTAMTSFITTLYNNGTPLQVVYPLATPIEIDLTPTEVKSLLGDNNVWSDSGTVEVEYRADTSLVINKILEALA